MMNREIINFIEKRVCDFEGGMEKRIDVKLEEYYRALHEVLKVLKGSEKPADADKFKVINWQNEYAACIAVKPLIIDSYCCQVYVVGLDGWSFTVDSSEHTALAGDEPAFVYAGSILRNQIFTFINNLHEKLKKAGSKKGPDRNAGNLDGGHQKTPGFILAKCVEVLNFLNKGEHKQIEPQCSGFTDVSMHTGCKKRDTDEPLTYSLVKSILQVGLLPPIDDPDSYFVRFMTEYYLYLASEQIKKSTSSTSANQAMVFLTKASRYGVSLVDSRFWSDADLFSNAFISVRKEIENGLENGRALNADEYQIHIPNLEEMEIAPSPEIVFEKSDETNLNEKLDETAILKKSKENLGWIPSVTLKTLSDCEALLMDKFFDSLDAYKFSLVFVQVEKFLFELADSFLKPDSAQSRPKCQSELIISVVDKLCEKIASFSLSQNSFLTAELKSRRALLQWLKFCILFEIGIEKYGMLSDFAPPLDFHDLEHLVLREKAAWDCLDVIGNYLERRRLAGSTVIFSGRLHELKGTLDFADAFIRHHHEHYERLWSQEQSEAKDRIDKRWAIIEQSKLTCSSIRSQISGLEDDLIVAKSKMASLNEWIWYNGRETRNPDWKSWSGRAINLAKSISTALHLLSKAKKAPAFLKQPLPHNEKYGKRAIFFGFMPQIIRDIWLAGFQAQSAIFKSCPTTLPNMINFHDFYDGPYEFRERKLSIRTPLYLFCPYPPKKFGSDDVESITSRDDGVFYANIFDPEIVWEFGNPFLIDRAKAVVDFTEKITNSKLQWAFIQKGPDTPLDRGNWALANLREKPEDLTREQFLALGNLRAFPLLQIFNVLESIMHISLPFKSADTHQLVKMVFYHIGELSHSIETGVVKIWKKMMHDKHVISAFISALNKYVDRVKNAPKNHEELFIGIEIIAFLSQFSPEEYISLSNSCSNIPLDWSNNLRQEIEHAKNTCNVRMMNGIIVKQHLFYIYAILAYETASCLTDDQVQKLLCLSVRINETRNVDDTSDYEKNLIFYTKQLLVRVNFMLARLFQSYSFQDSQLTEAARLIFPSRVEASMNWKPLDSQYCYYSKTSEGYCICVNVLNGVTLLNGSPPGRLSLDILKHPLYRKIFGENQNFTIEIDSKGVSKAIHPYKNRYYSFKRDSEDLAVHEEESFNDHIVKLRLLDSFKISRWGFQLPLGIKNLYSHWQSDDLNLIAIRPIKFKEREIFYLYVGQKLLSIPQEHRGLSVLDLANQFHQYDRMIFMNDSLKAQMLNVWSKFDTSDFIHVYFTEKRSLKLTFVRYRLSFELTQGADHFFSLDHAQFKVCKHQLLKECLNGFFNYLVLEQRPKNCRIIVPKHLVEQANHVVCLKRDPDRILDVISTDVFCYNSFSLHHRFKEILAADICGRIQLATLFAATSTYVPENWIGMTGFEMSIQLLRKCWVNRPLDIPELTTLESLLGLQNLPPTLVLLCHSILNNSEKLKFLYCDDSSNCSFDANQFSYSVNSYNLPSNPKILPHNIRLRLMEEESENILGIVRKTSSRLNHHTSHNMKYETMDISAMEKRLFRLTSENFTNQNNSVDGDCQIELPFPFPEKNKILYSKLGRKVLFSLKNSFQLHKSFQPPKLSGPYELIQKECIESYSQVSEMRADLETRILKESDIFFMTENWDYHRYAISWACNKLPSLNLSDMVRVSYDSEFLLEFNPMLTDTELKCFSKMVLDWMQLCVLEDRLERVLKFLEDRKVEESIRELLIYRKYDVNNHPEWLAFEVDQCLQIRPEQMDIVKDILQNPGSVTQLNMGLGKTRVIIPCLFLLWSRPQNGNVVCIYLLSALITEGFAYFHRVLTAGIFHKKLFLMPFNRDVKLTEYHARILILNIKYCQKVGGGIVLAPEHRLSLYLKKFDKNSISETTREYLAMIDVTPFVNIYDEVDEVINPIRQLVYAEGNPVLLSAGERRWGALFAIFLILRHTPEVQAFFLDKDIASQVNVLYQEYNMLQFWPSNALEKALPVLIRMIARSLFSPLTVSSNDIILDSSLDWMKRLDDEDLKEKIVIFITDLTASNILQEGDFARADHYQDILALRGFLAHGILAYCLILRHYVNYGVVLDHKTLMAIPFRAANLPVLRSEFAQPDCAVGLTILSYYNSGLGREQVFAAFSALMNGGPNFCRRVYTQMYDLYVASKMAQPSVDSLEKIDLTNLVQRQLLFDMYRKSMILINFWLGHIVFPTQTMIFPQKLTANSWNLTDADMSKIQCGFSGTVDSCIFLPNPLLLKNPSNSSLAATDGKMINHLLQDAFYQSLPHNSAKDKSILDCLIDLAVDTKVQAFIDAGALLCGYSNKDIAIKFLRALSKSFKGFVFFCTDNQIWTIIDERGRVSPLETSPIHESEAFVIFDQSRCRGADMKLKESATALLSIGPKMRKEDLMQAAGRLRKLEYGQSMIVTTTYDVETMLKDSVSLAADDAINMQHVLLYTLTNSLKWIGESLGHYSSQGLQFLKSKENKGGPLEEEISSLFDLYENACQKESLQKVVTTQLQYLTPLKCDKNVLIKDLIKKHVDQFGADLPNQSTCYVDQVERELENERKREQEREVELTNEHPAVEEIWDYYKIFEIPVPEASEFQIAMCLSDFVNNYISNEKMKKLKWNPNIFISKNFGIPIKDQNNLDDYLRPVKYGLYFPCGQKVLLLSDMEADGIVRALMQKETSERHIESPIMFNLKYLNTICDHNSSSIYTSLISSFNNFPRNIHALLELFDGQTDFNDSLQEELTEIFLENTVLIGDVGFFSDKRGFRIYFEGSSLERTRDEMCFKMFNLKRNGCLN